MIFHKPNLTTKNIREFTSEDTIFIRDKNSFNKDVFLCQFMHYDEAKQRVTGQIISPNDERQDGMVGNVITDSLKNCSLFGSDGEREHHQWFDSLGYAKNPIEDMKDHEDIHVPKHESYGVIRMSKHMHNGTKLFGSSIQHNQTISITICRATHERTLNHDWIHGGEELIEVEMSENQLAQFITSPNQGSGIPCTIRHVNMKRASEPPFITKQELFTEEFKKKMHNYAVDLQKTIAETEAILKKPNITKSDRELMQRGINSLIMQVQSNLPFIGDQFREQMDDVVNEAKIQIEAFAENVIRQKGLEALAANNPDLKDIILNLKEGNAS